VRSGESTKEIADIVNRLLEVVNATIKAVRLTERYVSDGVARDDQARGALAEIRTAATSAGEKDCFECGQQCIGYHGISIREVTSWQKRESRAGSLEPE